MAAAKEKLVEDITITAQTEPEKPEEVRVEIKLPLRESDQAGSGVKVDHYEHVTISNEFGEKTYYIKRGERVKVPIAVFNLLRQRYPDI